MNVPIWLMISIGFRPVRSDARPMSGPDTSWQAANTDMSMVACSGVAWNVSA